MDDIDFEALEEELAKIDPAELRYLLQLLPENVPAVQKIIQNVLDEPISEKKQKRLQPPLRPKPFQPIAPPRNRNRRRELLRSFDPFPPQTIRNVTDYQNEILNLYDVARFEGEERKGRHYKHWRFIKDLNEDLTPKFMKKIRKNVQLSPTGRNEKNPLGSNSTRPVSYHHFGWAFPSSAKGRVDEGRPFALKTRFFDFPHRGETKKHPWDRIPRGRFHTNILGGLFHSAQKAGLTKVVQLR